MSLLLLVSAGLLLSLIALWWALSHAVDGYEDSAGFHPEFGRPIHGNEPASLRPSSSPDVQLPSTAR